jgi:antitoxin component HigA of HigAB toxin-antitoxin module
LDLVNRPEYRVFREVSTYEAFYKLYPEMLEREILEGDATECVCKAMDEKNLTCKQLADKVGWSKKKLKRVLSGDITVKQVARLLFACDCRAEVTVRDVTVGGVSHEITT